jgi:hypothetical protein
VITATCAQIVATSVTIAAIFERTTGKDEDRLNFEQKEDVLVAYSQTTKRPQLRPFCIKHPVKV